MQILNPKDENSAKEFTKKYNNKNEWMLTLSSDILHPPLISKKWSEKKKILIIKSYFQLISFFLNNSFFYIFIQNITSQYDFHTILI